MVFRERENVVRLAGQRKKGLLRLVFSRFFLILILLLLEVVIIVGFYGWLAQKYPFLTSLQWLGTLVMVIYLFNTEMDSTAKLTWMFLIAVAPLPAAALLAFTRSDLGQRRVRAMVEKEISATRLSLNQPEGVLEELEHDGSGTDDLCRYLNRSGCFPIWKRTAVTYFPSGEKKFSALLYALEQAERFIFLEYFIISEGYMWGRILDVLIRKASAGVDVRVLYDGMCEISTLPTDYWRLLEEKGIRARPFSPLLPLLSSHYNYRDHRKIAVIDGKVAFNGGVNLADEYIDRIERFGYWKDAAVMLRGDAVKSFTLLFLQMWNAGREDAEYAPWLETVCPVPEDASGFVMPYADCPLDGEKVGESVYMDILNRATDYVHIMTPYLILDGELETALKFAAHRGVDVKLILPGIPDKRMAYALAKSHYRSLTDAGVQIFEYTPGFVHAKIVVSDGTKAVVGTINLDYRSLYHHFECATYLYRAACIGDIEADFQKTLAQSAPVTPETMRRERFSYRLSGALLKFLAPLM